MDFDNKLKPKQIPMKLYHGSIYNFDKPDPTISGKGDYGAGFYTTTDPETAKLYGTNLYEYDYQGGNFFKPSSYQPTQEQKDQLLKDYTQKIMEYKGEEPEKQKQAIANFFKSYFTDDGYIKSSSDFIGLLKWLGQSYDVKPYMEKLGLTGYQGLQVPLWDEDFYVVFDPKTLKLVKKTKNEL
jgi:hypothetical protein